MLVLASSAFVLVDLALWWGGQVTAGSLGPEAGLVLQLSVDFSLLLLGRAPRSVMVYALTVAVTTALSELANPGLLLSPTPLTLSTLPTAAPAVLVAVLLSGDTRFGLVMTAALAVIGARLWSPSWTITPFGLLTTVVPAIAALYLNARRRLLQSLRDRVDRAERERHLLADRARSEERRRLASEMHDLITHRLSLMVLHAGALGASVPDERVRVAAEGIRAAGAQALEELRDLLGVLQRERADEHTAAHRDDHSSVAELRPLVAESTAIGIRVSLEVVGSPDLVAPVVARTGNRVVQEGLTNVHKHAPGSQVQVSVRYHVTEGMTIAVVNGPAGTSPDPTLSRSGSGVGIVGLRHRVEVVGGSLQAVRTRDGGHELRAQLPSFVAAAAP